MARRKHLKEVTLATLILGYTSAVLFLSSGSNALGAMVFLEKERTENTIEYVVVSEKELHPDERFEERNIYYYISEGSTTIYADPEMLFPIGSGSLYDAVLVNGINKKGVVRINYNGEFAYLEKDHIVKDMKDIFSPVNKIMYARQNVNIRSGMENTSEEIFGAYKKNDEVYVIGENGSKFKKVKTEDGRIGYVFGEYLSLEKIKEEKVGFHGKNYSIPNDYQYQVVLATVRHEGGNSYEGALAVMSCILNRCDSGRWGGGNNPYLVTIAPGQFESYLAGRYRQYMGYNVSAEVRKGVEDALNGKRSHKFESFRANSSAVRSTRPWGVLIAGNWFF